MWTEKFFKNIFEKLSTEEVFNHRRVIMRASELKVFVVDVNANSCEERIIQDDLKVFYEIIDCCTIDITPRKIGGKPFLVICDDEGLFVSNNPISMADPTDRNNVIVGSVIITGVADRDGDLTSLTDEDVELIKQNVHTVIMTPFKGEVLRKIVVMSF